MAVPKRKVSKARRDKRRSAVWKLDAPALCKCSNCGELTSPHKVCKNCGYYKGVIFDKHIEQNGLGRSALFCCSSEKGGQTLFTSTYL